MTGIEWLAPWRPLPRHEAEIFEAELQRELRQGHVLYGRTLEALGRRDDRDDVMVRVDGGSYAVVHLTWREDGPGAKTAPATTVVPGWEAWQALMKADHRRFRSGS